VLARAAALADPAARVFSIDPHAGSLGVAGAVGAERSEPTLEAFRSNLREAGVDGSVVPVVARSDEVEWSGPIALLFVDGLHDYWSVARDVRQFERLVPRGAWIAFHDCSPDFPGVETLVSELLEGGAFALAGCTGTLMIVRRIGAQ
jgi:hypothetical protein